MKSVNEFNLYMLLMLLKQSYEWSHVIDKNDVNHDFKYRLNNFLNSGKQLFNAIEKEFDKQGEEINELYWNESEFISKFFEYLKTAELDKRNELQEIVKLYINGELNINYDKD